jgi:hypothetical protein
MLALIALVFLSGAAYACSGTQVTIISSAGELKFVVSLDGKPVPGLRATFTRLEQKPTNSPVYEELEEIPAGKAVTDDFGAATFKVKKGRYHIEFRRGELGSSSTIDIKSESDLTVPVEINWPQIERLEAQNLGGVLVAERLLRSGDSAVMDIAQRHNKPGPYAGAIIVLADLDHREITRVVADEFGRFALPSQAPGYYVIEIKRPEVERKEFHSQYDPQITGLLKLSDSARFADLSMTLNSVCGGGFEQNATQN